MDGYTVVESRGFSEEQILSGIFPLKTPVGKIITGWYFEDEGITRLLLKQSSPATKAVSKGKKLSVKTLKAQTKAIKAQVKQQELDAEKRALVQAVKAQVAEETAQKTADRLVQHMQAPQQGPSSIPGYGLDIRLTPDQARSAVKDLSFEDAFAKLMGRK